MSAETNLWEIKELLAKHTSCSVGALSLETRLGEDLKIIGDDAEEFLEEFARTFDVDMSKLPFNDYFPDEGSSDMQYYLSTIVQSNNQNKLLQFVKSLDSKFWGMFAKRTSFKTLTIENLLLAAQRGRWE